MKFLEIGYGILGTDFRVQQNYALYFSNLLYLQVSPSGAAICRCQEGYSHLPGQSTIDGCPTRRRNERPQQNTAPNRFRPQRPVNPPRQIISAGDPCQPNPCGTNAECSVVGNRAVCTCRSNTFGDPYTNCQVDPCNQDPCGINAECESSGNFKNSEMKN